MAITFRGSCVTGMFTGTSGSAVFALYCTPYSKVRLDVLSMTAQLDTVAAMTTTGHVAPLFMVMKVAGTVSGGMLLPAKGTFDTSMTPDPGVEVRQSLGFAGGSGADLTITGTPVAISEGFGTRNTTVYGQQMYVDDWCPVKRPANSHLYLNPGEALVVYWRDAVKPAGGEAFFGIVWEEDSLGTSYSVSGQVTLSGSPVTGAKILLVTDTDRDMPAPKVEVISTDGSGNWSKTLATGIKADAFVQHRSGETLYTAEGKPYLDNV